LPKQSLGLPQSPPCELGIASAEKRRLAMTLGVSLLNEWRERTMEQLAMTPGWSPNTPAILSQEKPFGKYGSP